MPKITSLIAAAAMLGSAISSFATISITPTEGTNYDTGANPRTDTVTLDVLAGDVVVMMATTNKKPSVATVSFTTTSGDTVIETSTGANTGNDTNPDQWAGYTTITTDGTYDFILTAQIDQTPTLNWAVYLLRSDAGKEISLISTKATDNFNLSSGTLDFSSAHDWTESRDAVIIEAVGSTNGTLNAPANLTLDATGGNANSTRGVGHTSVTGATGFTADYTLTWVKSNASAGVLSLAFAEGTGQDTGTLTSTFHEGSSISSSNPAQTLSLTVETGDVVALFVTGNKKSTAGQVVFSSTASDTLTPKNTATETGNDANPTQWIAYATMSAAGTFDFTATATGNMTANWGTYILHSSAGDTIELIASSATDNAGLAAGPALDFDNTYTWTGDRHAFVLEASGSTNGTMPLPASLTEDIQKPSSSSTRSLGHTSLTAAAGYTSSYSLTQTGSGSNPSAPSSSGVIGLVFSETVAGDTLTISEPSHDFTFAAADNTFDVTSNTTWSWSSSDAWITSSEAADQDGDQSFTYSVTENNTGSLRSGTITFTTTSGDVTVTHTVNQDIDPTSPYLSITPPTQSFDSNAANGSFDVTTNTTWTWTSSDAWLTSTETTPQTGDQEFSYAVTENTSTTERVGTITLTSTDGSGLTASHTVTQNGVPFLSITDTEHSFGASGGSHTLDVSSNTTWTWVASDAWITSALPADQTGTVAFSYDAAANPDLTPRTGTITYTGAGVTLTHTVDQSGADIVDAPGDTGTPAPTTPAAPSSTSNGKYTGFIIAEDGTLVLGYIQTLKLNSSGAFSGSMYFDNVKYKLKGEFDANGHFTGTIAPKNQLPADVDPQLVITAKNAFQVNGTVTVDGVVGHLTTMKASDIAVRVGDYTLLVLADKADATSPQGNGYGTMKISQKASVKIKGVLADGTKWTAKSYITPDAEMPLFSLLYKKMGSLAGMVYFRDLSGISDLDSEVIWHKPGEFNLMRSLIGSRYYHAKGFRLIKNVEETSPNTELILGTNNNIQSWGLEWTQKNKLIYSGDEKIKLKIKKGSGMLSGNIPDGNNTRKANGVVFQKQNLASGFATAKDEETQQFSIVPRPPAPPAN